MGGKRWLTRLTKGEGLPGPTGTRHAPPSAASTPSQACAQATATTGACALPQASCCHPLALPASPQACLSSPASAAASSPPTTLSHMSGGTVCDVLWRSSTLSSCRGLPHITIAPKVYARPPPPRGV